MDALSETLDNPSPVSLGLAMVAIAAAIAWWASQRRGLPPGPYGLPFLGYWFFFSDTESHLELAELQAKYGAVFSFTCTGKLFVNLGSSKLAREVYVAKSDNFQERMSNVNLLSYVLDEGIVFSKGEKWRNLRKFFLQAFKDHGMVSIKDNQCGPLYESIAAVIQQLRAKKGEPVNITEILALRCNTILRRALFGDNFVTDEEILEINKQYKTVTAAFVPKNLLLSGYIARYLIFPFRSDIRNAIKSFKKAEKYFTKMINDHKATYDEENIRDIIDEYYKEKKMRERNGDPTAEYFTDKSLKSTLVQFVGDGAVNVSNFVSSFLKMVTEHPEEQEKIYLELREVVGPDRQPSVDDRSRLPYTNAFLSEVLRMSDFVPYFPSMECTRETTLRGYRIPKGAMVVTNIWTSHHDSEVYEEPYNFNPSRFLNRDAKHRPEPPITFGMGKRICLGEAFVMIQTFLFLTTIIKNFRLTAAEDEKAFNIMQTGKFLVRAEARD